MKLPVYIVAGGQSRRFGSDKARALLGGVPLVCRVASALGPIAESVTVVAGEAGAYDDLGLTTIADARPGAGPMGGLESALMDRADRLDEGWLLLASCDLASPDAALVEGLWARVEPGTEVVAYRGQRWEPLFALYHSSLLPRVRAELDADRRAMWRLIESSEHVAVSLPGRVAGIEQLNSAEALKRLRPPGS